ncbi:hypothetical protein DL96DRAFT_1576321 [Flagelloscypha sp. PMI_526]|nr:hypothetical protein DL96DRAFT_1576321 [Flagelloscypha sp. PMI_526]
MEATPTTGRSRFGCQDCGLFCGSDRSKREHHRCNVCQKVATVHYSSVKFIERSPDGFFYCLTCNHKTTDSRRINTHSKTCSGAPSSSSSAANRRPVSAPQKPRGGPKPKANPTRPLISMRNNSEGRFSSISESEMDLKPRLRKRKSPDTDISFEGVATKLEEPLTPYVPIQPSFDVPSSQAAPYALDPGLSEKMLHWSDCNVGDPFSRSFQLRRELLSGLLSLPILVKQFEQTPDQRSLPLPLQASTPYQVWRLKREVMLFLDNDMPKLKAAWAAIHMRDPAANAHISTLEKTYPNGAELGRQLKLLHQ